MKTEMYTINVESPRRNLYWSTVGICLLILIRPFLVDTVPPLLDYAIHLSRAYIVDNHATDPFLNEIYDVDWRPIPNLASDILLVPLLVVFDVDVAGRILLGLCVLSTVIGVLLLHRSTFGHRSWWPLLSVLPAYHGALSAGFINYSIGVAFLLFALSASVSLNIYRSIFSPAALLSLSLIVFFCHAITFGLFILFSFFFHLLKERSNDNCFRACFFDVATVHFFPTVVPFLIYLYYSLYEVVARENHLLVGEWTLGSKVRGAIMPVLSGEIVLDILSLLFVVGLIVAAIFSPSRNVSRGLMVGSTIVLIMSIILPGHMIDAAFISDRLTIPACLVMISSINPVKINKNIIILSIFSTLTLIFLRSECLIKSWQDSSEYYTRITDAVQKIESGSSVAISSPLTDIGGQSYIYWLELLFSSPSWHFALINIPTLHSLPVLALTRRSTFSQLHFVWADKQILSLATSFQDLNFGDGGASTWSPGEVLEEHGDLTIKTSDYMNRFDYFLFVYVNHLGSDLLAKIASLDPLYADDDIVLLKNQSARPR